MLREVKTALTSLDVGYNAIDEETALAIVSAVQSRNGMTSLGLAKCMIGPAGAKKIAEDVTSAVLTSLDLSWNNLCGIDEYGYGTYDASGIKELIEAFSASTVLTNLELEGNHLAEAQYRAFEDAKKNKHLE